MSSVKLVQGDSLPGVKFTIRDRNTPAAGQELDPKDSSTWLVVSLAGATVSATASVVGSTDILCPVTCVVASPVKGEVILSFKDSLVVDKAGEYEVEVTVDFAGSRQTVYNLIPVSVRARHV